MKTVEAAIFQAPIRLLGLSFSSGSYLQTITNAAVHTAMAITAAMHTIETYEPLPSRFPDEWFVGSGLGLVAVSAVPADVS